MTYHTAAQGASPFVLHLWYLCTRSESGIASDPMTRKHYRPLIGHAHCDHVFETAHESVKMTAHGDATVGKSLTHPV